jgi:hypothetical protein
MRGRGTPSLLEKISAVVVIIAFAGGLLRFVFFTDFSSPHIRENFNTVWGFSRFVFREFKVPLCVILLGVLVFLVSRLVKKYYKRTVKVRVLNYMIQTKTNRYGPGTVLKMEKREAEDRIEKGIVERV